MFITISSICFHFVHLAVIKNVDKSLYQTNLILLFLFLEGLIYTYSGFDLSF